MIRVLHILACPKADHTGRIGINGPERRLANVLSYWREFGIEPVYAYPREGRIWKKLQQSCSPVSDFRIKGKYDFGAIFRISDLVVKYQARIIHTHGPGSLDTISCAAALHTRLPHVITRPIMLNDLEGRSQVRRRFYRLIDSFNRRNASAIVCVSQAGVDFMIKQEASSPQKVRLIYNGINLNRFRPIRKNPSTREIVYGMVAQLTPVKGWSDFISVIENLREAGLPASGLIVGDGPLRSALEKQVFRRGLGNHITFTGFCEDIAAVHEKIDIFLFTSHREGLSVAILEAMASGLPIIATDVGGTREQIEDGVTGFLLPPGDVVGLTRRALELGKNIELREQFGHSAREKVEHLFDERRMVTEYAALYHELLANNTNPCS